MTFLCSILWWHFYKIWAPPTRIPHNGFNPETFCLRIQKNERLHVSVFVASSVVRTCTRKLYELITMAKRRIDSILL